jgi:hypothetical protein
MTTSRECVRHPRRAVLFDLEPGRIAHQLAAIV